MRSERRPPRQWPSPSRAPCASPPRYLVYLRQETSASSPILARGALHAVRATGSRLDALFFQPEAESAESGLVADLEEARGRRGREIPMLDPVPGRGRDAVPLLPREGLVADAALAAAFDDVEDTAPRPPLCRGALARP